MNSRISYSFSSLRVAVMLCCLALGVASSACSDDTTDNNSAGENSTMNSGSMDCPDGERYNPIVGRCLAEQTGSNNVSTNSSQNGDDNSNPNNTSDNSQTNNTTSNQEPGNMEPGNQEPGNMEPGNQEPGNMEPGNMEPGDEDMGSMGNNMSEPDMGSMDDPDMMIPQMTCGVGSLKGRACAPSGDILAAATVTVTGTDCATGMPFTTTVQTAGDGSYSIPNVPSGLHDVTLASGSFMRTFPVQIRDGVETDLTREASKYCVEASAVKIAVISGSYDDVESILDDLQLDYDIKGTDGGGLVFGFPTDSTGLTNTRNFLKDPAAMAQYDIIFINCGNLWDMLNATAPGDINTIMTNLHTHFSNGRSIYASDWAHMFIERPFVSILDFFPAGGDDTDVTGARQGYAPQNIMATVESPELLSLLGTNSVLIDFPQNPPTVINNNWVMVAGADPGATVHLRGDAQQCMSTTSCDSAGATLTGSPLLVTYKHPVHGGSFAFTSFHNHAAGTPISPEISKILKFLIFQL